MRPLTRWLLFLTSLAVFGGVMGWISLRMMDLEKRRQLSEQDAQVQEKVRLALWRMDSLASGLLIRENSRPASHYQAFYAPDDLFNGVMQAVPKGQVLMPSPLFGTPPDLVRLHFEVVDGSLTSPQSPTGGQQKLASTWYAVTPQMDVARTRLQKLDELLKAHPEVKLQPSVPRAPAIEQKTRPAPAAALKEPPADKMKTADDVAINPPPRPSISNASEQMQRAQVLQNNLLREKKEAYKTPLKKIAPPGPKPAQAADIAATREASTLESVKQLYSSPKTQAAAASGGPTPPAPAAPSISSRYWNNETDAAPAHAEASLTAQRQALPALAGDLKPVWADEDLLLLREARLEGVTRLQGVWLDWPTLRTRLVSTILDLLPEARLIAVPPAAASTDATALVTLPVKLLPGRVPITAPVSTSTLRPVLIIAWTCLFGAALAIAFVLHRTLLLSERRAAFVSAVTHELRTPLTTFRLYSEMLADDMVSDPRQRKEYLSTLCDESTRLMHLVENVLSYSRIERGRTAARLETVGLTDLLHRIEPRLRQHAATAGLELKLDIDPAARDARSCIDALAVEQILFNLTDNACKYAAPDSSPRELHLSLEADGPQVRFRFRDFGPGLGLEARRKLFQPFAKSATEAAHSAPGVGLGLALSRRLAKELGGTLIHESPSGRGACFVLTLHKL